MVFENKLDDLELPAFKRLVITDRNPLAGSTRRRVIYRPNKEMSEVHRELIFLIRSSISRCRMSMRHATACLPGSSTKKAVKPHLKKRYIYLLDIHHAYEAVNGWRLANMIADLVPGININISIVEIYYFLYRYCLLTAIGEPDPVGLITGGPASPDLFNLYCSLSLDLSIGQLVDRYNLTYSRYLDDMVFSSDQPIGKHKRRAIREAIIAEGFSIAHRKSRYCDLTKGPVIIHGLGLDVSGRIFLPRHFRKRVNGMIDLASRGRAGVKPEQIHGLMGVMISTHTKRPHHQFGADQLTRRIFRRYREFQIIQRSLA
ncbi:MAG: reverse transcriptase domain-containing protein [Candidatus Vogelbacteria bacterium]